MINVGDRFERLLVLGKAERFVDSGGRHRPRWICRCDCGAEKSIDHYALKDGRVRSCGCLQEELTSQRIRHGHARRGKVSRTWITWVRMMTRCTDPASDKFQHYGGRGIAVCDRWQTFENFLADMGERPAGKSLDRIDVNGNYEPGNCRWATQKEQMRNTRSNRIVAFRGAEMSLSEAAERAGLKYHTVKDRIDRYGWSVERALSK